MEKLPHRVKRADVKTALIQRAVVKAATAITLSTHRVAKPECARKRAMYDDNTEALAMLGYAARELSIKRRQAIRPHLPRQLAGLCAETVPITTKLFGDNLSASVKEVKELDRISADVGAGQWKNRHNKRPFLGHRTTWRRQDWGQKPKRNFVFGGKQQKRPSHKMM